MLKRSSVIEESREFCAPHQSESTRGITIREPDSRDDHQKAAVLVTVWCLGLLNTYKAFRELRPSACTISATLVARARASRSANRHLPPRTAVRERGRRIPSRRAAHQRSLRERPVCYARAQSGVRSTPTPPHPQTHLSWTELCWGRIIGGT